MDSILALGNLPAIKIKVIWIDDALEKSYQYENTSFSFFVNHGIQMLITIGLVFQFDYLSYVCDIRYLLLTNFASFNSPKIA